MDYLTGYDRNQITQWVEQNKLPRYRADQMIQWIFARHAQNWDQMTNLPAELRNRLSQQGPLRAGRLADQQFSDDGATKLLLQWPDGALTETVLMASGDRRTVCVSTQVGCPVQCAFCASGLNGLQRSLTAGEIVEQVLFAADQLDPGNRISNVVIMGMGEPLANYENTLKAVRILNADWALNIAARHITISTIGLPDQIRRLADEPIQITLAVSLHAPDDQLRADLIPWAKNTPLEKLFEAIDDYYRKTHREVTLEYVLLDGVNCSRVHADQLAHWAHRSRCNVNLINYNPVEQTRFSPVTPETAGAFMDRLKQRGVNVHLRRSLGAGIDAACGQLRKRHL